MVVEGILSVLNPTTLLVILVGVIVGIIFGSIPGLTSTMAVALCLPVTFGMSPLDGIALLIALYVGGTSGGLISAILLKIPGTPSSVATTFDGAPMAEHGQGGRALGIGIFYSFLGTILSMIALFFIAPPLADVALKFGPMETFSICIFALTMIAAMISDNPFKAVMCGVVGIVISLCGISDITGSARFTFGISDMENGFSQLPVMIGLFATAEILTAAAEGIKAKEGEILSYHLDGFGFTLQEFKEQFVNFIRSALIGIGIGIVASETSNNASIGGALIPLLTLGIPGDTVTAIILGGLMLHGIIPGPLLFQNSGELVYGLFMSLMVATIFMLIVEFGGIRVFVRILDVPKYILFPIIFVLCIVGTYGTNHSFFDVWTCLGFGVIGYFMSKYKYPQAPMILGLVLGKTIEQNLIRGMQLADGNFLAFFKSPIAAVFLLISAGVILWSVIKQVRSRMA